MKIAIIETAYPLNSRTERFYQSLSKTFGEESVRVICWNRDGSVFRKRPNYHVYECNVGYGDRRAKLRGLRGFYKFVKRSVKEIAPDCILASHWDSLILASKVKTRNCRLVYENLDMPTGNAPVRKILRLLESRALTKTDAMTLASRFYIPFYKGYKGQTFVVENKLPESLCQPLAEKTEHDNLIITFLGGVRHTKIKENLMNAIQNIKDVEFRIFGNGPSFEVVKKIAAEYPNVTMYGRYNYSLIPEIYAQSDLIWAAYPSQDYNVRYAISNKYHETLHFGVPGIFSKGTKLGDMVESKGIGLTVDCNSIEEIRRVILYYKENQKEMSDKFRKNLALVRSLESPNWDKEIDPFIKYLKD